ncbi:uncharacterized protein [Littorina saxatilis]|uniref:uncharacterized protein n=1 Tax=Littorina saxatilis TaxID=31220 RepID=UPI0038B5E928
MTEPDSSVPVTVSSWCSNTDVLKAEVYWTLYSMEKHFSFRSFQGMNSILGKMFPNCPEARQFSCGESKAAYLVTFGLGPYFSEMLTANAKKAAGGYVLLFDESLNKQLQQNQLDVHIRFWDDGQVQTRYLTSKFLGHATADILYSELEECCEILGKESIVQLSMDGPNVNWSTFGKLCKDIDTSTQTKKQLYNVGSCGLHTLHNAFKNGYDKTGWDLDKSLSSMYKLFHDTPARREDFVTWTGCTSFPKKFCAHRWLENVSVCERVLEIWPHLQTFAHKLKAAKNCPSTDTFCTVLKCCNDVLFTVKLQIFISIAKDIEPFLRQYQTDKPVLPFLADDLFDVVRNMMGRFVKDDIMENVGSSTSKLILASQDLSEVKTHKDGSKINIGFASHRLLRDLKSRGKVSEKDQMVLRLETKKFLIHVVTKILEKSPLRYSLVRNLAWLKPDVVLNNKKKAEQQLHNCLDGMAEIKRVDVLLGDSIIDQYKEFATEMVGNAELRDFDSQTGRLDSLYFSLLALRKEWKDLWCVIRELLMLSHGQASVERGFSVNKEIMTDNMKGRTLVAQRHVTDHIANVGGAEKVMLSKKLLYNAASARQRYSEYLEEEKEKKKNETHVQKRKADMDEIQTLQAKKRKIEDCVADLLKSADAFAEKAEHTQNFNFIAKSNALRKSAKTKKDEVASLEKEIHQKLDNLKN